MKSESHRILLLAIVLLLLASACSSDRQQLPTLAPTVDPVLLTPPPTPPVATAVAGRIVPTVLPPPTATPTIPAQTDTLLSAGDGVPSELIAVARGVAGRNPAHFGWLDGAGGEEADLRIVANGQQPLARWIYAVAAPFATVADDISLAEVTAGWQQGSNSYGRLVVDSQTAAAFGAIWGGQGAEAQVVEPANLMNALWAARPSWTIMPFDRLSPELDRKSVV